MANWAAKPLDNNQKANVKKIEGDIGKESADKIGTYEENVGGGTPADPSQHGRGSMKGNFVVADNPDDPKAIKAKAQGKKVRYAQPRNEDGQFTYNSSNAKQLYYGNKSRGNTDLPFLKKSEFGKKNITDRRDVVIDSNMNSYIFHVQNLTANGVRESLREYFDNSGYQIDRTKTDRDTTKGYEIKKGKESAQEKAAKAAGITGKIGESRDSGGRKRYTYISKLFKKSNTPMQTYFNANNLPIGVNLTHSNNPVIAKAYKQKIAQGISARAVGSNSNNNNTNNSNANSGNNANNGGGVNNNTPNGSTPNSAPSTPNLSAKIDANAVKSDPKKFITDNRQTINNIIQKAGEKGQELDMNALIEGFSSGQITSFQDVMDMLEEL